MQITLQAARHQLAAAHHRRRVHERGMRQLFAEPPVATMLIDIVGVRTGAEAMSVEPPEQPARGRRRSAPRRVNECWGIFPKLSREQTREPRAEHVLPKVQPGRRLSCEQPVQHLPKNPRPPPSLKRNHPEQGQQPPLGESCDRQAAKRSAATPQRVQAHLHAVCLHGDDLALEKRLRALGKRGEEIGDDRLRGRQGRASMRARPRPASASSPVTSPPRNFPTQKVSSNG
jgi:hypothetical protein